MNVLPENDSERGGILLATCLLDYFPNACVAVARHSAKSNEKHNPGQPPHWARDKSADHRNKIARHLIDAGGFDKDGNRHSVALAWRGLALLEDELIAEGATPGRNALGSPTNTARQLYDETSAIAVAQDARLYADADTPAKSPHDDFTIAQDPPDLPMGWLASGGVPVESAYLASFGPNDWQSETLREYGIGDVEPATLRGIPDSFVDSHGNRITRRDVTPSRHSATNVSQAGQHPMAAEAIRDHDERLFGGEDRL